MPHQLSILSLIEEGERLKEKGMRDAVNHADAVKDNWSGIAYEYLCNWLKTVPVGFWFMTEDIRLKAEVNNAVPVPPSLRAWGGIIVKARKKN